MAILELDGVSRRFGGLMAVNDVSFSVDEGTIFGLIGPNGAGKTTLLNCVAGALRPSKGSVRFAGQDTTAWSADKMCRAGMSRTFQISRPFPRMTALENVSVAAVFGHAGRGDGRHLRPEALAAEVLDYVAFPRPKDTPADHLNTVQLKRLDLARALASRPRLLLLDELAAGLTPGELGDLLRMLRRIRADGITIIMVEHVMRLILDVCDRLVVLQYGQKIAEGATAEVATNEVVREAYLGQTYVL